MHQTYREEHMSTEVLVTDSPEHAPLGDWNRIQWSKTLLVEKHLAWHHKRIQTCLSLIKIASN